MLELFTSGQARFSTFNAIYTDQVMQRGGDNWGILAVSLRSRSAVDGARVRLYIYHTIWRQVLCRSDPFDF